MTDEPPATQARQPDRLDPDRPGPAMLRWAYAQGVFPMAEPDGSAVGWYAPDRRGVIPLEDFRIPKRVARQGRSGIFDLRTDTAFEAVMRACAAPRPDQGEDGTWINDTLVAAYVALFEQGNAHSVEAWRDGQLVGGLYGVHLGAAFMGESMFIRPDLGGTGASKVCLAMLCGLMRQGGFTLLDTQFTTPHLERFGGREISAETYNRRLELALAHDATWPDAGGLAF